MDFSFSEEQKMLRAAVRDFAEKEIAPKAARIDETDKLPDGLAARMAGLGLFGLCCGGGTPACQPFTGRSSYRGLRQRRTEETLSASLCGR